MGKRNRSIIGTTNTATNGMQITIIADLGGGNIVLMSEEGTIVYSTIRKFKGGKYKDSELRYPDAPERLGYQTIARNGQLMTIIRYNKSSDVTVLFEDGGMNHCTFARFLRGGVANPPNMKNEDRIGKKVMVQKSKMMMEIIASNGAYDNTVRFEDGAIREHVIYQHFAEGFVAHPSQKQSGRLRSRVGEENISHSGKRMVITEYFGNKNVTISFPELGKVVPKRTYRDFLLGNIAA